MKTEYDYINNIGRTHETYTNMTDKIMNEYYHKREVASVSELLQLLLPYNRESMIDVGTSVGDWIVDYRNLRFKKIVGIDISEERSKKAKEKGFDETYTCNAYDTPFNDESQNCLISNDVLVHVLQDSDKLRIFKEVKRILKNDGVFIFNFANANGKGFSVDTTINYCRFNTISTISNLIKESGLKIKKILPSYYTIPLKGANPKVVKLFGKLIFPLIDKCLTYSNNLTKPKVVYFGVVKKTDVSVSN